MRKIVSAIGLLAIVAALAACESGGTAAASSAGNGKPLGDTGVRVSGSVEAGGSAVVR